MVAEEPVAAAPAGPAPGGRPAPGRGALRRAGRGLRGRGPRVRPGPGRRRLPLPEPPRPGRLRRAVRARGPVGPAVGGRPRDPGHRRLQAAGLPGPDRLIRGVNVDGVMRTLEQRGYVDEVGRDPGPGQAVLYGTTDACSSRSWASTASTTCRRWPTSCPGPRSGGARAGLRQDDGRAQGGSGRSSAEPGSAGAHDLSGDRA